MGITCTEGERGGGERQEGKVGGFSRVQEGGGRAKGRRDQGNSVCCFWGGGVILGTHVGRR